MSTNYAEHAPPPTLADTIACLWTFEGDDAGEIQRIVPDGRCELIIHYGTPYREIDGEDQPPILFAGQLTRPLHLRARGSVGVIGIRFQPAGAWPYLGKPLHLYTNRRIAFAALVDPDVAEKLTRAMKSSRTSAERLAAASAHVVDQIERHPSCRDQAVEQCVARLETGTTLEEARAATRLAPRALQRRFAKVVGLPPQSLAAIIRLRRVFDALRDASVDTWTQAAHAAGYFDHPQMARDFRRFVGCTPTQFLQSAPGLATSLADIG